MIGNCYTAKTISVRVTCLFFSYAKHTSELYTSKCKPAYDSEKKTFDITDKPSLTFAQ